MSVRYVSCVRDPETHAWSATSADIPGLVSEASDFEGLVQRVTALVPGLLEENGLSAAGTTVHFLSGNDRLRSYSM